MGWRVVVVSSVAKLDYKMGYLVVRTKEKMTRIYIPEISVLILESTAISLTAYLLCALSDAGVEVLFCDQKRLPHGLYTQLNGSHDTSRKVRMQIAWKQGTKNEVWRQIIQRKIMGQSSVLAANKKSEASQKLLSYIEQVQPGDPTNREGHAAKVYFNALFGMDFTRDEESDERNGKLNYAYSILLSAVARAINAEGYITQIGVFHDNVFNALNLASDIMEPFRPFADMTVLLLPAGELSTEQKHKIAEMLNCSVVIDKRLQYMANAITIYVKSVLDALSSNNPRGIKFPEYELSIYESHSIL